MYSIMQFGLATLVLSSLGSAALLNALGDSPDLPSIQAGMHQILAIAVMPIMLSYFEESSSPAAPMCIAASFGPSIVAVALALEMDSGMVLLRFVFLVSVTFALHSLNVLCRRGLHIAVSSVAMILTVYAILRIAGIVQLRGVFDLLLCPVGSGRNGIEPSHLLYASLIYAASYACLQFLIWTKHKTN